MDGEQDRDQQGCKRQCKTPLSQRSFDSLEAAKPIPRTRMTPSRLAMLNRSLRMIRSSKEEFTQTESPVFMMTWLPVGFDILIESIEGLDRCATFGALHQC